MKPIELAPSILSSDLGALRQAVQQMVAAGCERIHLDVMDGVFVPPITFGAQVARDVYQEGALFEAHLMTVEPERHFEAFAEAGCKSILFHTETTPHAHRLVGRLRQMGIRPGVALNPATPASAIEPLVADVDLVLVMTVNPGWGGQAFIENCLNKVRQIRAWREDVDIEVDGGIDPSTAPRAIAAGANVLVAGSYIANQATIAEGVAALRRACG